MKVRKSIIGILLGSVLITNVAYAATDNMLNENSLTKKYIEESFNLTEYKNYKCKSCDNFKEKYDLLFKDAERYVPGIAQKGEQLYNEKMNLKKELRAALKKQRESSNLKMKEEMKKEISNIMKQVEEGKITGKEGERQLEKKRVEYKEKIKDFRKDYKSQHKKEIKARKDQKEKTKEAFEKFVKAVEAGDAAAIEKSFNSYYENSKALNQMLKQYIDSIKSE